MVEVIEVGTAEGLERLAPEWQTLAVPSNFATPFQSPDWLIPWWRAFGSGDLLVIAARCDGRLACVLPAFVHEWEGFRQVTLIGAGLTDYLDCIADASLAPQCVPVCLERLHSLRPEWDRLDWQDLPASSPLPRASKAAGLDCDLSQDTPCSVIALPRSLEEFRRGLPWGMRRNLRRCRDQLEATGPVEFRTSSNEVGPALDTLIRLHGERWHSKGSEGMLEGNPKRAFFLEALEKLAARNQVRFHSLRQDVRTIAISLIIQDAECAYGYITGFAPEYARFSPGSLLLAHALEHAIQDGLTRWDFLRGEEAYKAAWGAQYVAKYRLRVPKR